MRFKAALVYNQFGDTGETLSLVEEDASPRDFLSPSYATHRISILCGPTPGSRS